MGARYRNEEARQSSWLAFWSRSFAPWTGANPSGAQQAPEIQAPKGFKSFLRGRHLVGNAFEFFARSRAGSRIWTREAGFSYRAQTWSVRFACRAFGNPAIAWDALSPS